MPIGAYFNGNGREVYANMIRQYGKTVGKRVFYATAAKKGEKPAKRKARRKRRNYTA